LSTVRILRRLRGMKVEELLRIKRELFDEADRLTVAKGRGYGAGEDTLANMRLVEQMGFALAEEAAYIRLCDKVFRLGRILKNGEKEVGFEGLRDTIVDLINYATYIYALVEEKRNGGDTR